MAVWAPFASGLLFALGLGVGGMTQPAKVVGFLDIAGNWDPSLALVMVGAIGVYSLAYRNLRKRGRPIGGGELVLPTRTQIDRPLLAGSAMFGVGWGLSGYCPGPALTSVASGAWQPILFCLAMLSGMVLFDLRDRSRPRPTPAAPREPTAAAR